MRQTIIIFSTIVFLVGCDIPGYLDVKNRTENNASYLTYTESPDGRRDTAILEVPSNETKGILFGFGQHWTDEGIREYLSQIEKIKIITNNDTITMLENEVMFQFFKSRRRGLLNQRIKIKLK